MPKGSQKKENYEELAKGTNGKRASSISDLAKALTGSRSAVPSNIQKVVKEDKQEKSDGTPLSAAAPVLDVFPDPVIVEEPKTAPKKEAKKPKKKMGRPRLSEYEKRVRVSISMDPEAYEWLRARTRNGDLSRMVNDIVVQYIQSQKKK